LYSHIPSSAAARFEKIKALASKREKKRLIAVDSFPEKDEEQGEKAPLSKPLTIRPVETKGKGSAPVRIQTNVAFRSSTKSMGNQQFWLRLARWNPAAISGIKIGYAFRALLTRLATPNSGFETRNSCPA
jgi:hypothetical protein